MNPLFSLRARNQRALGWFFVVLALLFSLFDARLTTTVYSIPQSTVQNPVRLALLTDLHGSLYGKGQQQLIGAIHRYAPDAILLGGDIFDENEPTRAVESLLSYITARYPCYFVTGNHEYWSEHYPARRELLLRFSITILEGACVPLSIRGERIALCGVGDPDGASFFGEPDLLEQLSHAKAGCDPDTYTILLSHRPEYIDIYRTYGFDLILCGHAHGGQWRVPGLLNGVFAPGQGFFPRYAGGEYHFSDGSTMIVSRGLARTSSVLLPRIANPPELVIVDLCP